MRTALHRVRTALAVAALAASVLVVAGPSTPALAASVVQVSVGVGHGCGVTSAGTAYCWGSGWDGALGDGTSTDRYTPTAVAGGLRFMSVSATGWWHTCGLTTTGAAYCWGAGSGNTFGQLGDGTTNAHDSPNPVTGGLTFTRITAGGDHTCALTFAGAAYCWGANTAGQVGDGTTTERDSPTAVSGGLTFTQLVAGAGHTCGLTSAGNAYCWGFNSQGQLGDGTTTDRSAPTAVSGGVTFASLSLGRESTCGLTSAGAAYCWGRNDNGQLGDGTTNAQSTPTAVTGSHTFTQIAAGMTQTCGVVSGGAGYCWGYNDSGQLGDGTTTERHSPTAVSGGLTFSSIATSDTHIFADSGWGTTCGLTTAGSLYCWGHNTEGELGDGNTTDEHTPVLNWLMETDANTTVSAIVDPTFTFLVNSVNPGYTCNGIELSAGAGSTVASTSTAVPFGHLAAGARAVSGQQLQVVSNAGGGYVVYMHSTASSANVLKGAASHALADSGSVALPGVGNEFFGYSTDTGAPGGVIPSGQLESVPQAGGNNVVAGYGSTTSYSTTCLAYAVGTSSSTPADSYSATVVYTAIPTY